MRRKQLITANRLRRTITSSSTSITMNPRAFVVQKNLEWQSCVYTVMPVVNNRLLDLPFHVQRLHDSYQLLRTTTQNKDARTDVEKGLTSSIQSQVLQELGSLKHHFCEDGKTRHDGLLTMCCGSSSSSSSSVCDSTTSKSRGTSSSPCCELALSFYPQDIDFMYKSVSTGIAVDLQRYERPTDPRIKISSWPTDRIQLEERRWKDATETLIYHQTDTTTTPTMHIHEGLTSNVFVVQNNRLITTEHGAALSGSMARIVLALANALKIPIDRQCPTLSTSCPTKAPWTSAFITSASRPIVPIHTIFHPSHQAALHIENNQCSIYKALRQGMDMLLRDPDDIDSSVRPSSAVVSSTGRSVQNSSYDLRTAILQYIPYPLWSTSLIDAAFENDINTLLQQYPQGLI